MRKTRLFASAAVTAAALAAEAQAGGFYLQEQSVRGAGRAYSGEVADTGVASLWWNPAAIARSGREAYFGAHGLIVDGSVGNTGSTLTYPGGVTLPIRGQPRAFKPIEPGLLPNAAIASPVGDRLAVGLSVSAPYNFTTKYEPTAWTRYDALTSDLRTVDIQLTAAVRVTDWLDLGASANAERSDARLSSANPNLSPLLPDGATQLAGEGWDWGWAVGGQAHLGRLTLGASYKSKIEHRLKGSVAVSGLLPPLPAAANQTVDASATFTTPWIATLGARYALTDQLTLNGQVQRIGWGEFDAIQVRTATGLQTIAQDYKDVTTGGVGVDYAANPALTLRAGVQYDPTPTPNVGRTARVPDGDRWLYAVGATANVTKRMKLDAGLAYISFKKSRIDRSDAFYAGTAAEIRTNLAGTVKGAGYLLSVGLRTAF
ncbi:outer membrane protein transport protein [Phenylobacterium sp. LjRoot225]|uniref:porin n=1 Tax=Phenylobacterium sp. LjRoot225 TaxID=3342285 RepID=UPI003ED07E33